MQHSFSAAVIAVVVLLAHACAHDLRVRVIPKRFWFNANQDVEVVLEYTNNGSDTALIYQHYIPKQQLSEPLLEVTLNGTPVEYVGRLVKRSAPTLEDMVQLKPGESTRCVIQLSSEYDMTKTGSYAVMFKYNVAPMLSRFDTSVRAGDEIFLQSSPALLFAAGHPNSRVAESVAADAQKNVNNYNNVGCSASQESTISSAMTQAKTYASSSYTYLASLTTGQPRYTTWFGTFASGNLNALRTHFQNIDSALRTKPVTFDCGCTDAGVFAYVYANQPYKIYLCPAFWSAPISGTDSKGGTIVHETSHFTIVAGTSDYAYGQASCKSLAKSNPSRAVMNADSHEYFTENNPPQS